MSRPTHVWKTKARNFESSYRINKAKKRKNNKKQTVTGWWTFSSGKCKSMNSLQNCRLISNCCWNLGEKTLGVLMYDFQLSEKLLSWDEDMWKLFPKPTASRMSREAPAFASSWQILKCPFSAAMCKTVLPTYAVHMNKHTCLVSLWEQFKHFSQCFWYSVENLSIQPYHLLQASCSPITMITSSW